MSNDITIIIPAAGLGRRMRSYGPKALIEVSAKQTVIARQLAVLKSCFPQADVVVVVGFEAERVVRTLPAGIRVVENEHYDVTNVARSLQLGLRSSNCQRALIVYGDLVFNKETFDGLPLEKSSILIDSQGQLRDFEVGCNVVDGVVTHFSYGLDTKWGQIAMLTGNELGLFRKYTSSPDKRKHFGYEILNEMLEHDAEFLAFDPPGMKIVEIDTSKDIEPATCLASL